MGSRGGVGAAAAASCMGHSEGYSVPADTTDESIIAAVDFARLFVRFWNTDRGPICSGGQPNESIELK